MFDLSSYTNGFGVVFVPFVVGVIIRAILSTLHAGSRRAGFYSIIFIVFLTFPTFSFAGEYTGNIDSITQANDILIIKKDTYLLNCDNIEMSGILKNAYYNNQVVTIVYHDSTLMVQSVTISDNSNLDSKNISLLLGGVACAAFALGISLKI